MDGERYVTKPRSLGRDPDRHIEHRARRRPPPSCSGLTSRSGSSWPRASRSARTDRAHRRQRRGPSLRLLGHADVVPPTHKWRHPPFEAHIDQARPACSAGRPCETTVATGAVAIAAPHPKQRSSWRPSAGRGGASCAGPSSSKTNDQLEVQGHSPVGVPLAEHGHPAVADAPRSRVCRGQSRSRAKVWRSSFARTNVRPPPSHVGVQQRITTSLRFASGSSRCPPARPPSSGGPLERRRSWGGCRARLSNGRPGVRGHAIDPRQCCLCESTFSWTFCGRCITTIR